MTAHADVVLPVLVAVGVVSCLGALLAFLLELAARRFLNFGTVSLSVNGGARRLLVTGGSSLLETLRGEHIYLPSACGGRGSCGVCKVKVSKGGGPLLPTELPYLSDQERSEGIRISCQVKVRQDMEIWVPDQVLAIRAWRVRLEAKRVLRPGMVELRWRLPPGERISFRAGQYVQLRCPPYGKVRQPTFRAYSIASSPFEDDALELIVEKVEGGICSTWLCDVVQVGEMAEISGPYGDFTLSQEPREAIMIAAGSGMAPIKSMLHFMEEAGVRRGVTFFFSAPTQGHLYHLDLMEHFARVLPGFAFVPTLTRPTPEDLATWRGRVGRVPALVQEIMGPRVAEAEAYLCGGPGLVEGCVAALKAMGMPESRIFYDKFQ